MERNTTLAIDTTVLFERINAILKGQGEMVVPGGITITGLQMKGDTEWLYAVADVKGPYNGKAVVQFKVSFENTSKRFALHDLNIELADDSMFAKMASKFVNNMFADKLDGKLEEIVNAKFMEMLNDILEQLRNLSLPKGGALHFDVKSFNLYELKTNTRGLHFVADLTGKASLEC